MTLFDRADGLGGQLNLAQMVPGKEEFHGLVEWFAARVARAEVDLRLGAAAGVDDLRGFDEVIVATGVMPRDSGIPGQEAALGYIEVLRGAAVGKRVAIIGAGGIGFDVAEFLVIGGHSATEHPGWRREWGVGDPARSRVGWRCPTRNLRRARSGCCSARPRNRDGVWARQPGGSTGRRWRPSRCR